MPEIKMLCDVCLDRGRERVAEETIGFWHREGHMTFVSFCGEHEEEARRRVKYNKHPEVDPKDGGRT